VEQGANVVDDEAGDDDGSCFVCLGRSEYQSSRNLCCGFLDANSSTLGIDATNPQGCCFAEPNVRPSEEPHKGSESTALVGQLAELVSR